MKCTVCGHQNSDNAKTCASCGAALGLSATGTPVSNTPGIATGGTSGSGAQGAVYTPHLSKGIRLQGGNYAIGEVLGQGGFGITYKGGDLSLRRYVAIKEFFPQGCARQGSTVAPVGTLSEADYAGVKAKFIEEARTLARFNDPGIVRVFSVFEENNTAYMVMEFLEGETLSKRISEKGTLEESEVVNIAEKVGNALSVVHAAGLIHRDIKPDNICLTKDGRVVLIDFGTARNFASGKTVQQTTMLTPGYAPLEQYGQQARFGAYTDLYALAATLYHCLTGQVPAQATDRAAGVDLKPPHLLNPRISKPLSDALVWAMQVKATERPQNVAQFLEAVKRTGPKPLTPRTMSPSAGVVTPPTPVASGWGQPTPPQVPSATTQAAPPAPGMSYASVQQVAENQLVTNAAPQDVLGAVQHGFQAAGVLNPTIDGMNYRVVGATGMDMNHWAQNVFGQVTQDTRGIVVTISSNAVPVPSDYGRGVDEMRRLVSSVENSLRVLPSATPTYTPEPYSQPAYPSASPSPQPYVGGGAESGSGYYMPVTPLVRRQGNTILALGILGLCCCPILSIFAWVNGNSALIEYGNHDPGDRGSVVAGRIMGIIGTVLLGLYASGSFISMLGS